MAPSVLASCKYEREMLLRMNAIEELVNENKVLDKKIEELVKMRDDNNGRVSGMIDDTKKMRISDYESRGNGGASDDKESRALVNIEGSKVVIVDDDLSETDDEAPLEANTVSVTDLKEEEDFLLKKIEESTRNLGDHKKLLKSMERQDGRDSSWHIQAGDVERFSSIHKTYKEAKEKRIEVIRKELVRREMLVKKKFVMSQEASTSRGAAAGACSSTYKSRFVLKRKLNEAVIDCDEIMKKIPAKEKEAMVPKVLKVDEEASEQTYDCGFANCRRGSFSSAATLMAHLEKHYAQNQGKFDCPFTGCQFVNTQEQLTKHMRSKHTKEQLFICKHCSVKFCTMLAKEMHEKKHGQQDVWDQCKGCLRFYQVVRGSCRFCRKK